MKELKLKIDLDDAFKSRSPHGGGEDKKRFEMPTYTIANKLDKISFERPAEIPTQPKNKWHPLILASFRGQYSHVEALLREENVDVNVVTKTEKVTALMAASCNGFTEIAKLLIRHGAKRNMKNYYGSTALMLACLEGHYDTVKLLLAEGAKPNMQDENKATALIIASWKGCCRVAKLLLSHNAKVNVGDIQQQTALMAACFCGHYDVVELLLEDKATVDAQDSNGFTALMFATHYNNCEIVQLLLKHNAQPNIKDVDGASALLFACVKQQYAIAELLVKKLKDAQDYVAVLNNALLIASRNGHYVMVRMLTDNGAHLAFKDVSGFSSLSLACACGHYEVAKLLLEKGSEVDVLNIKGRTPLILASLFGHLNVVKLLIKHGAQVNIKEKEFGSCALIEASLRRRHSIVKHLLASGAEVDMQDFVGMSPLLTACCGGYYDIVSLLLQSGADPNLSDKLEETSPLAICSERGHIDIVQLLLENDANVNVPNAFGGTPLMIASSFGHYEVAVLLLNKKAKINLTDIKYTSALMFASRHGHYDMCKLLLERGAKRKHSALVHAANSRIVGLLLESGANVDHQDDKGNSALIIAATRGDYDTTLLLLQGGAKVNLRIKNKMTALMLSCVFGHYDTIKLLLDHGADPNLQDIYGGSSLHNAAASGNVKVVNLLLGRGAWPIVRSLDGSIPLTVARNVRTMDVLMQSADIDVMDLFLALQYAVSFENSPVVYYLFEKCLSFIGNTFCLHTSANFLDIAFFKRKIVKWITPKGAEIECAGLSISIPEGTISAEDSTDLLIHPCFSGPFELPAGYMSVSPAYLIQPCRPTTIRKDVTIKIHHYADLRTEEDCEDMVFLSANPTPKKSSPTVYQFRQITKARGYFRPGNPVGEIRLRHFCLVKVAKRRGRGRRRTPNTGDINRYSARLYRNLSPNAFSDDVSAVFCVCLDQPLYIQHCDSKIRSYYAISNGNEAADLSIEKGVMVSDEIVISEVPTVGWKVSFDRKPTKILKRDLDVPLGQDYPPQFSVFVRQTSVLDNPDVSAPELQVEGLDTGVCCFQLMIPGRGSALSSSSLMCSYRLQGSRASGSLFEDASQSEVSRKIDSTLTHRNVLTAVINVASEWRSLGLSLDIIHPTIERIGKEHSRDAKRCLQEVISCWLEGNGGNRSWAFLCEALKCPLVCRPNVANEIEQQYYSQFRLS